MLLVDLEGSRGEMQGRVCPRCVRVSPLGAPPRLFSSSRTFVRIGFTEPSFLFRASIVDHRREIGFRFRFDRSTTSIIAKECRRRIVPSLNEKLEILFEMLNRMTWRLTGNVAMLVENSRDRAVVSF